MIELFVFGSLMGTLMLVFAFTIFSFIIIRLAEACRVADTIDGN